MSKTAFLFPGQGAQHVGMGKTLAEQYPAAKALFETANDILGFDLASLCFEGPEEKLNQTDISQPALYVSSFAALEKLKAEQPDVIDQCAAAAGLSLGEYTALAFAGAISFEDGLRVVRCRGEAMQAAAEQTASGMVSALLLDEERINSVLEQVQPTGLFQPANFLCPGNTVLSGAKAACEAAVSAIEEAGGRAVPLSVAGAFHTEIMQPAVEPLTEALNSVSIDPPRIPVISNVSAEPHTGTDEIRSLLVRQVVSPVRWEESIRALLDDGVDQFYEIGPGRVLKGLLKRISRKTPCEVINDSA